MAVEPDFIVGVVAEVAIGAEPVANGPSECCGLAQVEDIIAVLGVDDQSAFNIVNFPFAVVVGRENDLAVEDMLDAINGEVVIIPEVDVKSVHGHLHINHYDACF